MSAKSRVIKPAPVADAPADLQAIYARLSAVLIELFEHPDCPAFVSLTFSAAQTEILNKTSVFTDVSYARHFLPLALAELTEREGDDDMDVTES